MLYQMRLDNEPFERLKKGEKTLEIRLFDEKRQKLELDDEIEFVRRSNPVEKVKAKIFGLLVYNNFADLIEDMSTAYLGYEESEKAVSQRKHV